MFLCTVCEAIINWPESREREQRANCDDVSFVNSSMNIVVAKWRKCILYIVIRTDIQHHHSFAGAGCALRAVAAE